MGGKATQRNNNANPSSSSGSAELLHDVKTVPYSPAAAAAIGESMLHRVNPEIRVCFKKLNKKCSITRVKGLQELNKLLPTSKLEDVVEMLPIWAYSYKMVAVDTDDNVREAAQMCHGSIAAVCGRQLARVLRAVLPVWLTAQYDDFAPAALHAQRSLNDTFPKNKMPDVINFCKSEIISYVTDNVIPGNKKSIINKKIESEDQRKLAQTRRVTGSLHGMECLLQTLPARADLDEWLWERLQPVLASDVFWGLAEHDSLELRTAWYGALSSCARRFGSQLGAARGQRCVRLLLAADLAHPRLCDCLLHIMQYVQDWDEFLGRKDLLNKRIQDLLENGGWGDASELGAMLLRLLEHLPEDMITQQFYESFFKALFTGLDRDCIMASESERQHWLTSIEECLRFLSIQEQPFGVEVTMAVHCTWLKKIFSQQYEGTTRADLLRTSAHNMAALLNFWRKQSLQLNEGKYYQLVKEFWQNITATVFNEISNLRLEQVVVKQHIDGHLLFLQSLQDSADVNKPSIKFENFNEVVQQATTPNALDQSIVNKFHYNFDMTAQDICAKYFKFASEKKLSYVFSELLVLLKEFGSKDLYLTVARQFNVTSAYGLYDQVVRSWLAGNDMRFSELVDVVYLMLPYLNDDEKASVFASFQQFPSSVIERAIYLALSPAHISCPTVRNWLRSDIVAATLEGATLHLREFKSAQSATELLEASVAAHKKDLCFPWSTICRILEELKSALEPCTRRFPRSKYVATVFASELAEVLANASPSAVYTQYTELVYWLFHLDVMGLYESSEWHHESHKDVTITKVLCKRAREIIHGRIDYDDFSIQKIQAIASLCPYLISSDYDKLDLVIKLTYDLCSFDEQPEVPVEFFALRADCIDFDLYCLLEDNYNIIRLIRESSNDEVQELTKSDFLIFVNQLLFRMEYFKNILGHRVDIAGEQVTLCDELLQNSYMQQQYIRCLHDMAVFKSLHINYTFWFDYEIIDKAYEYGTKIYNQIVEMVSKYVQNEILKTLEKLSAHKGYYWAYARVNYDNKITKIPHKKEGNTVGGSPLKDIATIPTVNGSIHAAQANNWSLFRDDSRRLKSAYMVMKNALCNFVKDDVDRRMRLAGAKPLELLSAIYDDSRAPILLFFKDMSNASWVQMVSNAAILDYLCAMIENEVPLSRKWWHFVNFTLRALLSSVYLSMHAYTRTKVAMVCCMTLRLYSRVCIMMLEPPLQSLWDEKYAPDIHSTLLLILLRKLESGECLCATYNEANVVGALLGSTEFLNWSYVGGTQDERAELAERAARGAVELMLRHQHYASLWLAYTVLVGVGPQLASMEDCFELSRLLHKQAMLQLITLMDDELSVFNIGENVYEPPPRSHGWLLSKAALMLAVAFLELEQLTQPCLRKLYMWLFHERKLMPTILSFAFRLLPREVVLAACGQLQLSPSSLEEFRALFTEPPVIRVPEQSDDVGALACRAIYLCMSGGGALAARTWWLTQDTAVSQFVLRITEEYVTPTLAEQQMKKLVQQAHCYGDVTVTKLSSLHAKCVLSVESERLPLVLWLSDSHPLEPIAAEGHPVLGRHPAWLNAWLARRGGSLAEALGKWRVAQLSEYAAECAVCWHRELTSAPRMQSCQECGKMLHRACLRSWIESGSKATCPFCRTPYF